MSISKILAAIPIAALFAGTAIVANADDRPGPGWITIEQAAHAMRTAGYDIIGEIEADDGVWQGKAWRGGVRYKVRVDPRTAAVTEQRRDRDRDDDD